MGSSLARVSIAVAGLVLAALALSGCGAAAPAKPASTGAAHTPSPTPSASATQKAQDDVLFTVQANVRDKTGNTITIRLTGHKPIPYSDDKSGPLVDGFVKACGAGVGGTPVTAESLAADGSILMPIDIASSTGGKTFAAPLDLYLGSHYYGQTADGPGITNTSPSDGCYGGYSWATSGTVNAISDFGSGNPGPDLGAWRNGIYGFAISGGGATIEACTVTVTDLAKAADVASVPGWANASSSGTSCGIGYTGE